MKNLENSAVYAIIYGNGGTMKWTILLLLLAGCGTAKDVYIDNKYDLCRRACDLKYSKYDYQKKSACLNKCQQRKNNDVK